MRRTTSLGMLCGLAICAAAVTTDDAQAHFRLESPAVMTVQADNGNPQKDYPCGDANMTLTGDSTAFTAGDTVTVTINETIYHPGHYRVALAMTDMSELPADPPITPSPDDQCAMTEIMNPPVFPVIADGMLAHSEPFNGEQSFEVTLPDDVECENCVLQVVQYMSSHAAPCFYYHCAEISIAPGSSGDSSGGDPGTTTGDPTGEPGTTTGNPDPTGDPTGPSTNGNSETGDDPPDPTGNGDTSAGTAAGTGTDGMGQDGSGSSGGCNVAGSTGSAMFALLPLLFATRRSSRRARGTPRSSPPHPRWPR